MKIDPKLLIPAAWEPPPLGSWKARLASAERAPTPAVFLIRGCRYGFPPQRCGLQVAGGKADAGYWIKAKSDTGWPFSCYPETTLLTVILNKLPWWDALIVSAAQTAHCKYLLTEDLQEAQKFGTVQVINPFQHSPQLATVS